MMHQVAGELFSEIWNEMSWNVLLVVCMKFIVLSVWLMCLLSRTVNRRLDEWAKLDQLDLNSVETDVDEKVEDKVPSCSCICFVAFPL